MTRVVAPAALTELAGTELGKTDWRVITQDMVDRFADLSGDHQWVHVDRERAAAGPFGAPIAHGFLVLAMVTAMMYEVVRIEDVELMLNKGLNRTRITAPVRVGDRVRGRVTVTSARARPNGYFEVVFGIAVELDGGREPVLVTDLVLLLQTVPARAATGR